MMIERTELFQFWGLVVQQSKLVDELVAQAGGALNGDDHKMVDDIRVSRDEAVGLLRHLVETSSRKTVLLAKKMPKKNVYQLTAIGKKFFLAALAINEMLSRIDRLLSRLDSYVNIDIKRSA